MNLVLLYCLVYSFLFVPSNAEPLCDVVPLETWAGSTSGHENELSRPVNLVVVTHTVTSACTTDFECERLANAIRNSQKGQGLNDIGLSFLVGGNGKIYEGAGWKIGTHTAGYSDKSISLSFIGDFRELIPSEEALQAAEKFLGCFLNSQYLDYNYSLVGHRQLISTISPGDALQNLIQSWPHWSQIVQTRLDKENITKHETNLPTKLFSNT